jgi:hypothetical protein
MPFLWILEKIVTTLNFVTTRNIWVWVGGQILKALSVCELDSAGSHYGLKTVCHEHGIEHLRSVKCVEYFCMYYHLTARRLQKNCSVRLRFWTRRQSLCGKTKLSFVYK